MEPSSTKDENVLTRQLSPAAVRRATFLLFTVLAVANAWMFAAYRYVPFQDHPSHLLKVNVLLHPTSPEPGYAEYFRVNRVLPPNILNDYLTAGAAQVQPLDVAARLTVALGVILVPLSVWFWISRVAPGREYWAVLSLTLVWSTFLMEGNENFCLSVALLFFFWGFLATWDGSFRWSVIIPCLLLAVAIYLGHFLVFLLAGYGALLHIATTRWRCWKTWVAHGLVVLPGILLAAVWMAGWGGSVASRGPKILWETDPLLKLLAVVTGIRPEPWEMTTGAWYMALGLALAGFIAVRAVLSWREGKRFPALLCLACFIPAVVASRWFIISRADSRLWWVIGLTALALLPAVGRRWSVAVWLLGVVLAVGTNIDVGNEFLQAEANLTDIEKQFDAFPEHLRLAYIGDPKLPRSLHRAFEYYHIRHGGVGPYHLMGPDQSVNYVGDPPPHASIFAYGPEALGPWLNAYDAVLIVGNDDDRMRDMVHLLRQHGYLLYAPPPLTLLLSPKFVRAHSAARPSGQ